MPPFRLGLIGAGRMGRTHLRALAGSEQVAVTAIAEALGRDVPASKYSPSMDLHPMFRADVAAKDAAFLHSWSG